MLVFVFLVLPRVSQSLSVISVISVVNASALSTRPPR